MPAQVSIDAETVAFAWIQVNCVTPFLTVHTMTTNSCVTLSTQKDASTTVFLAFAGT